MKQILLALLAAAIAAVTVNAGSFTAGDGAFLLDGKPFTIHAAELHYPRIPRPYWEHRIKMCKALGMNTVCLYVFWNIHEQREGEFDFTGQNDVAAFVKLLQRHGMYAIVRPGPYVCAEWEMGGLPWWLLKHKDIALRTGDPYFMERVTRFEQELGKQLAPLTIEHGGPIIMMQVENEYGSYGINKPYVAAIRDCLRGIYGDKLLMFQCDWSTNFENNALDDLLWTMNFGTGSDVTAEFARLGTLRPDKPMMCSEYWSGWYDKWGEPHETRDASTMVAGIKQMLERGISFSLYMTHGGTSFGHWSGANTPGYRPLVTSYDYDAPIDESGRATEKFRLLRDLMQQYSTKRLPAVPKPAAPLITLPPITFTRHAPLTAGITATIHTDSVPTFEQMDLGWGCAMYSTTLPALAAGATLTATVHDFAVVSVGGKQVGTLDRRKGETGLRLPATHAGDTLTILVEGMGRINFGTEIDDRKGIIGDVTIATTSGSHDALYTLRNWTIGIMPDDCATAAGTIKHSGAASQQAGYHHGTFTLKATGDTFIDTTRWGKGQIYINGHAIGRYWNIGPQQSLYVPGCWLRRGTNDIIVLDLLDTPTRHSKP